eukprot:2711682-Prymnesium_polylepis.1
MEHHRSLEAAVPNGRNGCRVENRRATHNGLLEAAAPSAHDGRRVENRRMEHHRSLEAITSTAHKRLWVEHRTLPLPKAAVAFEAEVKRFAAHRHRMPFALARSEPNVPPPSSCNRNGTAPSAPLSSNDGVESRVNLKSSAAY